MDISTIKQKIAALEAEIVPNSVSPERVASILSDITSLVENMGYLGYEFLGVATPTASPSFDKDLTAKKYFYIAVQQGTYTNFGGLTVGANDGLTILAYNGTWTKTATGTAMKTDITSLQASVTNINTKILPLSVSFDLDKIDALTDSSGSTDIKAAFTPLSGIGVAPVAGNILRSGNVIKNSQEVTVIWSDYDSKTAYYSFSYVIDNVLKIFQTDAKTFVRVAKTIVGGDVGAEIEDLQDKVSIGKAPVWITMTLESEPHDPTHDKIGDIIFFEEGNYLKEVVRSATGGMTLGQAVDMETGRLYVYGGNLCKWEDGDFVPFYLDDINTLKSKARYEYSLSKILALTDTSEESAVEEAFTPTYAPEGSLSPRVPKAGDLLIDGNNTVVVSEGTQIFFSFTYQEEIISMRVYSGGSSFRFNVWKFPAGTVYDFNSIDTLTESSTADEIKKALTPKIGDGMRIPNSGDIMLIGIEENPDTVSVLYRYRNTFAYYHNRLLTTIEVEGEDDSLRVVKTISRNYVYDFDKINALTNASTFSDIMHAFSPLIIGTEGHIPKTGDLLTSGYDEEGNAVRSAKVICHNGNSFAYCYDSKHVTVKLVGEYLGSSDMRVEKTVTDLKNAKVFDLTKIDALTGSSSSTDVQAAFTVDGKQSVPQVGDILRTNSTDYPYDDIVVYAQSTDNGEGIKSFKYLLGTTIRAIQVMPDFSAVNVTETVLVTEDTNNFVRPELQIQSHDLRIKAPAGALKETDEVWFYRRGQWRIRPLNEETKRYQTFKKSGWRRMNTVAKPSDLSVQLKFNKGVSAGLVVKLVSQGGSSDYDLFKVRIDDEENSDTAFTDFFRYFFCEYIDKKSYSNPEVIFRMKNGRSNKDITVDKSTKASLLQRVQRWGLAVWRNGERITPVMEFNVTGYIESPRLETVSNTDLKIGLS